MSSITLALIIFFTLYNGADSKIKHKDFIEASKWVDKKSRLFIKNFAFKSNKELLPIFYSKNKKLFIPLLIISFLFFKLNIMVLPISIVFFISMILNAILISKKDIIKEAKNSAKFWGFGLLSSAFFIFIVMFYKDSKEYEPIRQVILNFKIIFEQGANNLGIELSTFIIFILAGVLFLFTLYFFAGIMLRGFVWVLLLVLKCYTKFCFSLNKRQPLKPFYLLSQTIIVIFSFIISEITTPN